VRVFSPPALTRKDVQIVGVFEPDTVLSAAIAKQTVWHNRALPDLDQLDAVHPDAVATFTNTFDPRDGGGNAAARHVPVMMENRSR